MFRARIIRTALSLLFLFLLLAQPGYCAAFDEGVKAYNQHNYRLSAQKFEQVLHAAPGNSTALYYLAITYQALGDPNKARSCYQQLLDRFPGTAAAQLAAQALGVPVRNTQNTNTFRQFQAQPQAGSRASGGSQRVQADESAQWPNNTRIYFTREGNELIVDAEVNNRPIKMVFDTGAEGCVFGKNQLKDLGINPPTGDATGASIGVGSAGAVKNWDMNVTLKVGQIAQHNVKVQVQEELKTPPLLGQTFFKDFQVTIDNGANSIVLVKKSAQKAVAQGQNDAYAVPFTREGNSLIVSAQVNERPMQMIFDTGAESISFTKKQLDQLSISVPEDAQEGISTGIGGETASKSFSVRHIKLGPVEKYDIPVHCVEEAAMPHPLLGQEFYNDWQYEIDNAHNVIHFTRR